MRALRCLSVTALAALLLTPAALAGGRNPGSVLVYPVQRSGPHFFTIISVTNSNLLPSTPFAFGGATNAHFEYVNTTQNFADPLVPTSCVIFDRVEYLTPADTLSVVTKCHNAFNPAGQSGYLVITAENPGLFDTPWSHNYLMGSALVVNSSGGMYSIGAIPFNAIPPEHEPTDIGNPFVFPPTDPNGQVDFNDQEYEKVADKLYIDSFLALGGSQLALINLEGGPTARNTLRFDIWNDNEFQLSVTRVMGCWFDVQLTTISTLFSHNFLSLNTPNDPDELDINCNGIDDLETGWATIESLNVSYLGGQFIASDGALLGAITAGGATSIDGGELLWESVARNPVDGSFLDP
jgi:hypothetical protein